MSDGTAPAPPVVQAWGRWSTLGLGVVALIAGQIVALFALTWWHGASLLQLPNLAASGVDVTLIIAVSTPVQVLLLAIFARMTGSGIADYLGLVLPRRSEIVFGVLATLALIAAGDLLSWLLGKNIVTAFQSDIYRTAAAAGWLPWLWLAIVVATPIGEETLFRGFLFRGWVKSPRDTWPAIVVIAVLWAISHVQYDWYVIAQVFTFGLLLGWLRWATGSTILTILLHGLINFEGMIETIWT
jgi:membrane protease YdiL (CAAX protease family)